MIFYQFGKEIINLHKKLEENILRQEFWPRQFRRMLSYKYRNDFRGNCERQWWGRLLDFPLHIKPFSIYEVRMILLETSPSSLGRYVFGSEISYNKAPPRLPGLGC